MTIDNEYNTEKGDVPRTPSSLVRERKLYRSSGSLHSHFADEDGVGTPLATYSSQHSINGGPGRRSRHSSGRSVRSRLAPPEEYHGDLKPSLQQGLTPNLLFHCLTIMFGSSFLFGYNIGVLNQPSKLIQEFYNETLVQSNRTANDNVITLLWSVTTTMFLPGGVIGAFSVGWLADRVGRKKALWISHLFAFAGAAVSACCVMAQSPSVLMVGRFITGINCGMAVQLGPMYTMEIIPFNMKGAIGTGCQLFVTMGLFVSSVLGLSELLGTAALWPYLLLLNAVPAAISMVLLIFLPESPRYLLIVKGDYAAAEKAIQFDFAKKDVSVELEEMETESKMPENKQAFTICQLLATKSLLRPLLIACMLQVIQQLSGINAIFFYSSAIFSDAGVPEDKIAYCNLIPTCLNVLMTFVAVPLMDKAGRRPLLLIPMVVMVIVLAVITVALNLQSTLEWMSYVSIACVAIYVAAFAVGLGPIPWLIGAELFRQGPRSTAMSIAGMTNWFFTIIVALAFPSIQKLISAYTFVIFFVFMVGFLVFVYFFVPETKDKTFEEVASQFQPGPAIEVEEVVEDDDVFDTDNKNLSRPNYTDIYTEDSDFAVKSAETKEEAARLMSDHDGDANGHAPHGQGKGSASNGNHVMT